MNLRDHWTEASLFGRNQQRERERAGEAAVDDRPAMIRLIGTRSP
jgi:hypothetical protein